jgi:hypothetical protein
VPNNQLYSKEALIAETGAAFLCAIARIAPNILSATPPLICSENLQVESQRIAARPVPSLTLADIDVIEEL